MTGKYVDKCLNRMIYLAKISLWDILRAKQDGGEIISCLLSVVLLLFCIVPITASAADPLTVEAEKITIVPTLDGAITEKEWG